MIIRYIKTAVSYFFGALLWMVLISLLKLYCIVNVPLLVEGLWTEKINEYFVKNLMSAIAFDASDSWCDGRYIYTARYYPGGQDDMHETKSLSSMVDIGSWEKVKEASSTTTYQDNNYRYVLHNVSDGIFMEIFDK
jgi:hypothetical protein